MTDQPARSATLLTDQEIPKGAVVVGLDGSEPSTAALRWAAQEAAYLSRPLHLLAAQEQVALSLLAAESPMAWNQFQEQQHQVCVTLLRQALEQVDGLTPGLTVTTSSPWGRPAQQLIQASLDATCVVVGNRGRGRLAATMLGTVSLQVASHATGAVVVIREWSEDQATRTILEPRRAVVGVDGSADSRAAIRFALDHVGPDGTVDLLAAWWLEVVDGIVVTTPGSSQWQRVTADHETLIRDALHEAIKTEDDPRVRIRVERAQPAAALVSAAGPPGRTDLVVVGTRGRGGFRGLVLGSVSQQVLTAVTGPVAVVR